MNKTFIIAEVGINHNGNIETARQLIAGAKECGADAVKFQKRNIEKVYTKEELDSLRESPWGNTFREQKQGLEFGLTEYKEIDEYCKKIGIEWFASPWDLDSVEFLKQFDLKFNKVPSPLLTHEDLLINIARQGKCTFISTGMSDLNEIKEAVKIFKMHKCPFELMHCNSTYPAKDDELNLACIQTLRKFFNCPVGYSGHSTGIMDGVLSVVYGASSVEKHITLNRAMYGSDQPASLELNGFRKMVDYIRYAEMAIGSGIKFPTHEEEKIKNKLRRYSDVG